MCQIGPEEIVIVGGFNGKFLNDYYTLNYDTETGEPKKIFKAIKMGTLRCPSSVTVHL